MCMHLVTLTRLWVAQRDFPISGLLRLLYLVILLCHLIVRCTGPRSFIGSAQDLAFTSQQAFDDEIILGAVSRLVDPL